MLSAISRLLRSRQNSRKLQRSSTRRIARTRLAPELLESRVMLANITTLNFHIPTEVANLGVQAGLYSNTSRIYLDPTSHQFQSLGGVASGQKLPLITLASPQKQYTAPVTCALAIPAGQDLISGELFIFVGTVATGLVVSSGSVAAPKAAPDPATATTPDNFAQFEFNYKTSGDGAGLDIDISAVDSTGYPFTLVYPSSANLPFPLNPLGITLDQTDLNLDFQAAFSSGGKYAQFPEFAECATFAQQQDPQSLQVAAPQDILSAEASPLTLNSAAPTADPDSQLAAGASHYYRVTAFSDNVIANSGGVVGETLPSNCSYVTNLAAGNSAQISWTQYFDPNTAGYNIYRYSTTNGDPPTDSTDFNLIAQVYGAAATTYLDQGAIPQTKQISVNSASNYGFNPLSEYYTAEIQAFFSHYAAPNSFVLDRYGARWIGNTVCYTPSASWNTTGATYTVLQLTAQNDVPGKQIQRGDVLNIYQPIFASNTRFVTPDAPPMPGWMSGAGGTNPHESPAEMVFACDAVFASNKFDPDVASGDLGTALGAIENSIVSAFNRGIATNFAIPPDNWAAFPQMLNVPTVAANSSSKVTAATTYYYVVTAVNVYGETTPSLEVSATLNPGQAATLNWSNGANAAPAKVFKIYRGITPDTLTLLATTLNGQQTSYTDLGQQPTGSSPANQYFAAGSTANWYAAFVQTNSLLDPVAGVSINGLSYGFPYSDQGGVSTNILFPPGSIPESITVNLGAKLGPGLINQSLPDAVANTAYRQTLVASGRGTGTTYKVTQGVLPSWLSLDLDTGVLSGTAPGTTTNVPSTFTVMVSNSAGSLSMPFSLSVVQATPAAPLTVAGLNAGVLTLPDADVTRAYSAQVQVTGGTGPYTLNLASGTQLPAGLQLGTLGTQAMTSPNGIFTLSGTQTQVHNQPNVGFNVVVSDAAGHQLTFTMNIRVNPALSITTTTIPTAFRNQPYWQAIGTNNGGDGIEFAVTAGSLPAGLTLTSWGVLSGTPTAAGSFPFTITATDPAGGTTTCRYGSFSVGTTTLHPLAFVTTTLPSTSPGATYSQTIQTQNGCGAITFDVVNGALPGGLSLSSSGVLANSGGSITPGTATFTVRATDSLGNTAFQGYQLGVLGITACADNLASSATTLVIRGAGFDPTPANNTVTFPSSGATDINVTAATPTALTVAFTGPLTPGTLNATVTINQATSASMQVATVVAASTPTITSSTGSLAANATTLVISGTGFNAVAGATPLVTLSSGTVRSVTVNSATQLTVTLAGPLTLGTLNATVTLAGATSSSAQVANVVSASTPSLDVNASNLFASSAATLVIGGVGFDPSATGINLVTLSTPSGSATFGPVTVNSANQLTISGVSIAGMSGPLWAVVTVNGVASASAQVATILAASTPVIVPPPAKTMGTNATTLVVNGWGFVSGSSVALTGNYALGNHAITGFTTTVDSSNQITLTNLDLSGGGAELGRLLSISAQVSNSYYGASGLTTLATVLESTQPAPTITAATGDLSANAATLTITGSGFDANGPNVVALFSDAASGQATATAALGTDAQTGQVTSVTITTPGCAYVAAPTVTFSGGGATTQAIGTAVLGTGAQAGQVVGVTIDTPGSGYTSAPTVALNGIFALPWTAIAPLVNGGGQKVAASTDGTQLTVTLAGALPEGRLYASVATDGVPLAGGPVQVAAVAGTAITPSTANLSLSPTLLVLHGAGFDPAGTNHVKLYTGQGQTELPGTVESVVANSSTQLTVVLKAASPLPAGELSASAVVDGIPAGAPVQVANIVAQGPTVSFAANRLAANASTLVIWGADFGTAAGSNTVTLSTIAGSLAGAVAGVTANSASQLTITLNPAVQLPAGLLYAAVSTATATSSTVQVATIAAAPAPTVHVNTNNLAANATTLVITGTGFDPASGATNTVTLSSGTVQSVTVDSATQLTVALAAPPALGTLRATVTTNGAASPLQQVATVVAGSTPTITAGTGALSPTATTLVIHGTGFDTNSGGTNLVTLSSGTVQSVTVNCATQLTVALNPGVRPLAAGPLTAAVLVDGVRGSSAQVANVAVVPVITASTASWAAGTPTLTINGTGFDPTDANNSVALSSGAGIVASATSTTLVIRLTTVPTAGVLSAHVVVNGVVSQQAQVATVFPKVTVSTASLAASARTLVITGAGFDPVASHNLVSLSSGSGVITSATASQLAVTLSSPPRLGALTATVVVNGESSSGKVANVVPGSASTATSTLSVSAASVVAGKAIRVTLQAKDAVGNNLTTGGLKVTFAFAAGSAGGTLSAVTDNRNGTYTATFTSSRMGATTFTATLNGNRVTSTAAVNVIFQSSFPGTGRLGAPWLTKAGSFTVASSAATATAGGSGSLAIYIGTAAGNVSATVTVSRLTTGDLAALVTRYSTNTAYYRAGIFRGSSGFVAVIQRVTMSASGASIVTNLAQRSVTFSNSGRITFQAKGSTLQLLLNNVLVASATDSTFPGGSVGICGSPGTTFAGFSATAAGSSLGSCSTYTPGSRTILERFDTMVRQLLYLR